MGVPQSKQAQVILISGKFMIGWREHVVNVMTIVLEQLTNSKKFLGLIPRWSGCRSFLGGICMFSHFYCVFSGSYSFFLQAKDMQVS